jgi:hypothetical protein
MDTFSHPSLAPDQNPLTDNTHASATVVAEPPNLASACNVYITNIGDTANWPSLTPPNCLRAAHISIAFPASTETEQQEDANRSIGRTYCIGTTADSP